ncbi:MAG: transporter, partial [Aeromicrobium sp.]|nr:transporter [Aeromicrobium sp.]
AQALDHPSPALEGLVVFSVFGASVVAQIALRGLPTVVAATLGCGLLALGMLVLVGGVHAGSVWLIAIAAIVSGAGQGLSFSKGLAAVLAEVAEHERAGVTSAFFVVAYIAISLPVIGVGVAAQHWGLTAAGTWFSAGVAALAVVALVTLVVDRRRAVATA